MEGVRSISQAVSLLTALAIAYAAGTAAANDHVDNPETVIDTTDDGVDTWVTLPGSGEDGTSDGGTTARVCRLRLDRDATGAPKWVVIGSDGTAYGWFFLSCDGELVDVFLLPLDPTRTRPATSVMAEQAYRHLPVPAPKVAFNPPGLAIVGEPTWLWVDPSSWRRRTTTVGVTGFSVTVSATPESVTWRFGAGLPPLTCAGPGTPYDRNRPAGAQRTGCAHTFRRGSAREPAGAFAASATVTWRIDWQASDGTRGSLPPLRRTTWFGLRVAEVETVVSRPT